MAIVSGLDTPGLESVTMYPLSDTPAMSETRYGEQLFYDASTCFLNWHSCASCHQDGRSDPLSWDLLNDGRGNPKQIKSLLYSTRTPPVMSLGVRANARIAIEAGYIHDMFAVVPEEDLDAVHAYLDSLKAVRGPALVNGRLTPSATRGRNVFIGNCIECHSGPYFTDGKKHNLGTGTGQDAGKVFDTPTLVEIWRTAPYFHDGRYGSLEEAILAHPFATNLSAAEQSDLLEYLRSIDPEIN